MPVNKWLVLCLIKFAQSADILYLGTVPSPSHYIWNQALAFGLLAKGHHVTMVAPDKGPIPENFTHILLEGVYGNITFEEGTDSYNACIELGMLAAMNMFYGWVEKECENMINTKGAEKLIQLAKSGKKFDLIVADITAGPCFYPIFELLNYPPIVGVTAFMLPMFASFTFGNALQPSYIPWFSLDYTTDMSLSQRAINTFLTHLDTYWWQEVYANHDKHYHYFRTEKIPPIFELEKRISMLLANTDPILDHAQPVPPNIIPVGGLHTRPGNKLPKDLQTLADKATDGIIVFSLGTNFRSDHLSPEGKEALISAFGKMKETVIWKFESELKDLPKNVIIKKWLPQNDILGHKNVKLFIGHGGALSTHEAMYHGVPIIAVPFFFDQFINAQNVKKKEVGLWMDVRTLTHDIVYSTIRTVIDDHKYKNNAIMLSKMFKDRMETPLERGVFWIEYVLRHKSTKALTPQLRNMSFIAGYNLDIFIIITIFVVIAVLIFSKLVDRFCVSIKTNKIKTA